MIPYTKMLTWAIASVSMCVGGTAPAAATLPSLTGQQRQAAGITIARAAWVTLPGRAAAFGLALDPRPAQADFNARHTAVLSRDVAAAEVARLRTLYAGGAGASLKTLQAARVVFARSAAAADAARARFAFLWAPLAALPEAACQRVIDAAVAGSSVLVRADLTDRHAIGELPRAALVDVDGLEVAGRVLGLMRTSGAAQSVGLLIEVKAAPRGFAAGARVPVALSLTPRSGRFLPRDAVLYGEDGPVVYREVPGSTGGAAAQFEAVKVRLLLAHAGGWIVAGIGADDEIVIHGAGVLWSLQGLGGQTADDDD